ncbi:MAG: M50 family metallopeptidase [Brotaphodocola sp.]
MNTLAAILLFGMLIMVHEFGHFLFAKLNGIGVTEFSIGMGPRLFSIEKGETRYSLKLLPFGGSCEMVGEDAKEKDPRAFHNKSVLARISVIAAGPVFNFILAFLFAWVIVSQIGHDAPILHDVTEGSPAQEAGLMPGDKITSINKRKIESYRDVSLYLFSHPGETVTIQYERPFQGVWQEGTAAEKRSVVLTPKFNEEYQQYMLGVVFRGYEKADNLIELFRYSLYEVKYCIVSTIESIGMLFRHQLQVNDAVAGPVQIVTIVGETVEQGREAGARALILILANWGLLLSSSLGFMNLLPIPALDGGRLFFLLIELVRGEPIDPEKEGMVHMIGMIILMALMMVILFNDIRKLVFHG